MAGPRRVLRGRAVDEERGRRVEPPTKRRTPDTEKVFTSSERSKPTSNWNFSNTMPPPNVKWSSAEPSGKSTVSVLNGPV